MTLSRALSLVLLPVLLLALPGCDAAKRALDKAASSKDSSLPPLAIRDLNDSEVAAFIRQPGKVNVLFIYDFKSEGGLAQISEKNGVETLSKALREYADVISAGRIDRSSLKKIDAHVPPGKAICMPFRDGIMLGMDHKDDPLTADLLKKIIAPEAEALRKVQAPSAAPGSNPPRELAERDFEGFTHNPDKLSVVVFHADWCGPCQKLKPVMADVADGFSGTSEVGRFNVDNCRDLAARLNVSSIPDVRFYRDGKEVGRFTGYQPDRAVRELFKQHTAGLKVPAAPAPAASSSSGPGSVTRMKKDWLPPGVEKR